MTATVIAHKKSRTGHPSHRTLLQVGEPRSDEPRPHNAGHFQLGERIVIGYDRVEVTLRICLSLILTAILTLGSYPSVIPPSQRVTIASMASAFTMVLPTLMLSIGAAVFPGMAASACVGLLVSTMLLAAAAVGGVHAYIGLYFVVALVLAGLRFTKEGASSAMLLVVTSLSTMSLASVAAERGMGFVTSLWTEKGVDNPHAVFRNTLIGMCWAALCISSARLVPPWRTARAVHSRKFLPKMLKDVATFIREMIKHHIEDDVEDKDDADDGYEKPSMDDMIATVVKDATTLVGGGVAKLTALEPRIWRVVCRCSPPVDSVTLLNDLTDAVNDVLLSALTLRAFSKAGFEELEVGGLKEAYENSADVLERCATALATMEKVEAGTNDDVESALGSDDQPFDPILIDARTAKIKELTNEWIDMMASIDRTKSHFDRSARSVYAKVLMPWIYGGGVGLIVAIVGCFVQAFSPLTWKRIFLRPYYDLPKAWWAIKFAIGFTLLVAMQIHWPAFANFELSTRDEAVGAYFYGWYLIAYAFSTTQTVEGTWKKGLLRALGTSAGGFSAWLALTACGDSAVGLGIWLTAFATAVAFFGLPHGFSSRFGLNKDMAWGVAYFSMTQSIVAMEVFLGYGGKNDITLNRIVSNLVGIAMAMVMGCIPPGIYGSSPREAKFMLEDKKRVFRDCIELVLDGADTEKLNNLHATAKSIFISGYQETNGNFDDTTQLGELCILKPNPKLKIGLGNMAVVGSSILSLIRFGIVLGENEGERFIAGSKERHVLEMILDGLDIEEDKYQISSYDTHRRAKARKVHKRPTTICNTLDKYQSTVPAHTTFAHLCIFICYFIMHREISFDDIEWGFLGKQHTSQGRRTTLPILPSLQEQAPKLTTEKKAS